MSTVSADLIHRLEREALARAIRHEERIRRLMRVYGLQRKAAEEAATFAERVDTARAEDEADILRKLAAYDDRSGAGDCLGVVVILALFLCAVALVRLAL